MDEQLAGGQRHADVIPEMPTQARPHHACEGIRGFGGGGEDRADVVFILLAEAPFLVVKQLRESNEQFAGLEVLPTLPIQRCPTELQWDFQRNGP